MAGELATQGRRTSIAACGGVCACVGGTPPRELATQGRRTSIAVCGGVCAFVGRAHPANLQRKIAALA